MIDSLLLHQGPGLNGLYLTANPTVTFQSETATTYALKEDYSLHILGIQQEPLLKPEAYKLLDILVYSLGNGCPYQIVLPLESYMRLTGHTVSEANKNAIRPKLQDSVVILGRMSMDWAEGNGRYEYKNVLLFDQITYRNGAVRAKFSAQMESYLLNCPTMKLPKVLLSISGKSPHSYALGRRCLLHDAINGKRGSQTIRVSSLLDVCPGIPRSAQDEAWPPSILERRVISPLVTAMDALAGKGILQWDFKGEPSHEDYKSFAAGMVEFTVTEQKQRQNTQSLANQDTRHRGSRALHFNGAEFLNL